MGFWRFSEPIPGAEELYFSYDGWLVTLSVVIAIMGAFAMLRAIDRFGTALTRAQRTIWAVSGAVSMAFGVWAMHFAGTIAIALPAELSYGFWSTTVSVLPALIGGFAAVHLIGSGRTSALRLNAAAGALGLGICAMHYVGMEAVRFDGFFRYGIGWFLASVVAAHVLAVAALLIRRSSSAIAKGRPWQREALSTALLGGAVSASHYVAMAAVTFYSSTNAGVAAVNVPPYVIEALIIAMTLVVGLVWLGSLLDNQLASVSASLRQSEALNRAVITVMRDAHFLADSKGFILSMNPSAATMFGYEPDELVGRNVSVLMPSPHREQHDGYIARHIATGASKMLGVSRRNELFGRRKNGTSFPVEILITRFEMDKQLFFSGTIRDLSEFAASMENTKRLIAAIDQTAEAIVIVDPDMRVVFANPAFWRQTGTTAEASHGRRLDEFAWNPAEADLFSEMLMQLHAGKTWSGKLGTARADGSLIHESVTTTPVVANGKTTCYIQVRRDITDQLLMEQQLRHAQKLESIGQLSAGIAHELNTPSQFVRDNILFLQDAYKQILGLIETVRATTSDTARFEAAAQTADLDYLSDEVPRAISQSIDGMNRITAIVRAMKEFSHQGREKTPSDINHAIESTITVATNEWKYVADVVFDLEPSLPQVPCVLDEFNQVVLNIVVNAAHAIADVVNQGKGEKGTIRVSTRHIEDFVELRIADTGTGMSPETKAHIFEPFFTTKEVGRGTGQGLSIAYAIIVEKHGGSIEVETQLGKGSCFVIRLPLGASSDPASVAAA